MRAVFKLSLVLWSVFGGDCYTLDQILSSWIQNLRFENVSQSCGNQMEEFRGNLENPGLNPWALQMVDATSKLQSGIMSLNVASIGNFNQCVRTKVTSTNNTSTGLILGKYCLGFVDVNVENMRSSDRVFEKTMRHQIMVQERTALVVNMGTVPKTTRVTGPTWSICLPDGCTTEDINHMVNTAIDDFIGKSGITVNFNDLFCQTEKEVYPEFTTGAIITVSILGAYAIFIFFSTTYDIICTYGERKHNRFLTAFSAYTNSRKLFKTTKGGEDQMHCLNGLRFLSMVWVVAGHQYSISGAGPISNTSDLIEWTERIYSMFLISGTIAVDTFLVVSGALVCHSFLKARKTKQSFNYFTYYLHRYIRLTPPFAATILVSSTLLIYMGSGPRWPSIALYFQGNCVYFWWSALLYVQNYVNVRTMCVGQTWYLDIDMQLYLISPIIFYALWKRPKATLCLLGLLTSATMAAAFYSSWHHNLTAILSNVYGDAVDYSNEYYLLTHTRAAPWFIGAVLGYYIFKIKSGEVTFNLKQRYILPLWLLCLATLLFCILIGHGTLRGEDYDQWGNALHITFVRPLWSVAISWLILFCVFDKGFFTGIVNGILSLPVFQVLNRLTYCIYLTHVTMLYMMASAKKTPDYFNDLEMAHKFWGTLWFSLAISVVWVLAFESPMVALEKIVLPPSGQKKVDKIQNNGINFQGDSNQQLNNYNSKSNTALFVVHNNGE